MMQFLGKFSRNWIGMFLILIGFIFCSSLRAADIYVSPSGTGDGSISSPSSLQDALGIAASTAEHHVLFLEQGTYSASSVGGFTATVVNNTTERTITLSGGWAIGYTSQNPDPETTNLHGGTTTRVLNFLVDGGTAPVNFNIELLTIKDGYVFGGSGAGIQADISSTNGGVLSLYINNCVFRNNAARKDGSNVGGHGGGLYATGYVDVSNTTFESNSSNYHGGAIIFTYRPPYTDRTVNTKVDNCVFITNYNVDCCPNGSAIANYVHLAVTNSRFEGQTGSGSPIHSAYTGSYLSVSNSLFFNNKITYWGSGVQFWDSDGEIKNSVFIQNNAGWNGDGYGAVTYLNNSGNAEDITISNCTFLGNRSKTDGTGWGGALHSRGANLTIANSIFWDNGAYGIYSESGNATISYSDIQGGLASTGFTDGGNNITDDPGFAAGEYHLPLGSPCIDKGSNAAAAGILTDIDGEHRIFNGTIDMGADEFVPMVLLSPVNGETFDACSYFAPPLFQWTLNQPFQKLEIRIFTPANPAKPAKVKVKDPAATQFQMTQSTWKKILKLPGLSGGALNWKLVGTNKGQPIVETNVFTMTIVAPEFVGNPVISPVTQSGIPTLTWENSCGTKFKAYFSADSAFSKSKKLSFKYQGSTNPDDPFSAPLSDKTWLSIRNLIGNVAHGPHIFWKVESWDIIKRYKTTDVMEFTLLP